MNCKYTDCFAWCPPQLKAGHQMHKTEVYVLLSPNKLTHPCGLLKYTLVTTMQQLKAHFIVGVNQLAHEWIIAPVLLNVKKGL